MAASPIAIVGISLELPSGGYSTEDLDHHTFFEFLLSGGEAYETTPQGRFNFQAWKGTGLGHIHVDKGAFLKQIDTFDNVEFGISSRDAQTMAPATRKLLEHSFLALLDSGIDYRLKNVGCFMSGTSLDLTNVSEPDELDARGSFAGYPSMIANRISNHLDLLGPSVPVDTACSSTLTAMHLAVQAISTGDCEAALVGGCQLNHRFIDWISYSQGSLLAKDGKCKPFDAKADGFSRAEGCAVVVVKPLEAAIRDHDHIYGTILATSINSTGGAAPPGAPVGEAQRDAMIHAFQRAGKNPRDVNFVEMHATGTAKGDPTEANWVGEHFSRNEDLFVGSVKGNIGHTEIVAFMASLSKSLSILNHKVIPPQVNVTRLNPGIHWDKYKMKLPFTATPLPCRSDDKSMIAISSSGIGGSNGHVVIESPPVPFVFDQEVNAVQRPTLLTFGGLSSRAASAFAASLTPELDKYRDDYPALSTILGRRTKQATWRTYGILDTDGALSAVAAPQHCARIPNSLVFVFSGQGPQHKDMGCELFEAFPVFRDSVLRMDEIFKSVTGRSIIHDYGLFSPSKAPPLPDFWPISIVLPSIAIFQMALFDLLVSLGLKPDALVGHSAGETAVLYASGAAPQAMAVELAIIRGKSFTPIEKLGGTMAAISCSAQDAEKMIEECRTAVPQGTVDIACFNTPTAVAIAGEETFIDAIVNLANERCIFARKIRTKVPFHSAMMEHAKDTYLAALEDLCQRYPGEHCPQIPVISTCTGKPFDGPFDAQYFWNSTRSAVQFTEAIDNINKLHPNATFVELSPHPVLSSYVLSMIPESSIALHSIQRPKKGGKPTEYVDLLHLLGKVTVSGLNMVDFTGLNRRTASQFNRPLPAYPFAKKAYPLYPNTPGTLKQMMKPNGPLNHPYLRINKETHPTLAEHVIRGEPIMPAAGFLEMAIEFGAPTLMNVNLRSILSLSSERPVHVNVKLDGAFWSIHSTSATKDGRSSTKLHADGYLSYEVPVALPPLDITEIRKRCPSHVGSAFYPSLSYFSNYGPPFQRVTSMFYGRDEALASINGLDEALASEGNYFLHPAILDACIQVTAHKPFHGNYDPNVYYLPSHFDAVIIHEHLKPHYFPPYLYAHIQFKKWSHTGMQFDIALVSDTGARLCTFVGLEVAKHRINPLLDIERPVRITLQPTFYPPCKPMDVPITLTNRSDLFKSLDNLVIQREMSRKVSDSNKLVDIKSLPLSIQQWTSFLENLNKVEHQVEEGPHLDAVIEFSISALTESLAFMRKGRLERVLNILVISDVKGKALSTPLVRALEGLTPSYVQLFLDTKHGSAVHSLKNGMVRKANIEFTADDASDANTPYFDVAIVLNAGGDVEPTALARKVSTFLVPGGMLIATCRNPEAWKASLSGTKWYIANYDKPSRENTYDVDAYASSLNQHDFTILHKRFNKEVDPFHFSFVAQKPSWSISTLPRQALCNLDDDFIFSYTFGCELDLQFELSALNVQQALDIWITATEGRDGAAAQGLTRALRREYVFWTIRLVVFPSHYDEDMRESAILSFPLELLQETEVHVSENGTLSVPRLIPYQGQGVVNSRSGAEQEALSPSHVSVHLQYSSVEGNVTSFIGSVLNGSQSCLKDGTIVAGLTVSSPADVISVDSAAVYPIPNELVGRSRSFSSVLPGLITSVLAPGMGTFTRPHRLFSMRILITHSESSISRIITAVLSSRCSKLDHIAQDATLYDISKLPRQSYDLIVSGYTEKVYSQVLTTLLGEKGKLFLWNDPNSGLCQTIESDPCTIGDALRLVFEADGFCLNDLVSTDEKEKLVNGSTKSHHSIVEPTHLSVQGTRYDPNKVYVLLGGIGTIGIHLASYLYERGARRIALTSRSGKESIKKNPNVVISRLLQRLMEHSDLQLTFHAVDARKAKSMDSFFSTIGRDTIGGCIFLTAVLSDALFSQMAEIDFSAVYESKLDALEIVQSLLDVRKLEFLVGFTSVSGLMGFGGQSNYASANTALEEELDKLPNGFSFVCPGVNDSTLILAGASEESIKRLNYAIAYSITMEDVIRFFDDAMFRFQEGQYVGRYFPNLEWESLEKAQKIPLVGAHLVPSSANESAEDEQNLMERMTDIVREVLNIPVDDFSPQNPLTAYGIDSLSASRLSFLLRPYVEVTQIQLLAGVSLDDIQPSQTKAETTVAVSDERKPVMLKPKHVVMDEMLRTYAANLSPSPVADNAVVPSSESVLITGTTGTLGAHILSQALGRDDILYIFALNRKHAGNTPLRDRQRGVFDREGLDVTLLDSERLILLEGDLALSDFGLEEKELQVLLTSVTHIVHNAWNVDFLAPLSEFEGLIRGTRNLIDFAQRSLLSSKPSLSFISSVAIYRDAKLAGYSTHAPEAPILNPKIAMQTGYMESKWLGERLFNLAAERGGLRTNIIRVGLLTGTSKGVWTPAAQWFPAIVESASYLGCLPEGNDTASWIPVDLAASSILDMRQATLCSQSQTLHLIHPKPTNWQDIMEAFSDILGAPLVPYVEWLSRLESAARQLHQAESKADSSNGARASIQLIPFYQTSLTASRSMTESMGLLPNVRAEQGYRSASSLQAESISKLGRPDVEKWVEYWRRTSFIPPNFTL